MATISRLVSSSVTSDPHVQSRPPPTMADAGILRSNPSMSTRVADPSSLIENSSNTGQIMPSSIVVILGDAGAEEGRARKILLNFSNTDFTVLGDPVVHGDLGADYCHLLSFSDCTN